MKPKMAWLIGNLGMVMRISNNFYTPVVYNLQITNIQIEIMRNSRLCKKNIGERLNKKGEVR